MTSRHAAIISRGSASRFSNNAFSKRRKAKKGEEPKTACSQRPTLRPCNLAMAPELAALAMYVLAGLDAGDDRELVEDIVRARAFLSRAVEDSARYAAMTRAAARGDIAQRLVKDSARYAAMTRAALSDWSRS